MKAALSQVMLLAGAIQHATAVTMALYEPSPEVDAGFKNFLQE